MSYKIISVFLVLIAFHVSAQNTSSPYSVFGIGDLNQHITGRNNAMGGGGYALRSSSYFNFLNPASSSSSDSLVFLFEFGASAGFGRLTQGNDSKKFDKSGIDYMAFGNRITSRWAYSLGLTTYSKVNYRVSTSGKVNDIGTVNYYYLGNGGINKIFFGNSLKINNNISLGINLNYLFGSIDKTRLVVFPSTAYAYNTQSETSVRVRDIFTEYALQYSMFNNDMQYTFGIVANPRTKISVYKDYLSGATLGNNISGISSNTIIDTIDNLSGVKDYFNIPASIGTGFCVENKNKWLISADVEYQDWKNINYWGTSDTTDYALRISFGGEYIPDWNSATYAWKRMRYRAGLYYNKTPYLVKNTAIDDMGVTFGLGIPHRRARTSFNFAIRAGVKGTVENNLIREKYFILSLSLSLSDIWFLKYKYE